MNEIYVAGGCFWGVEAFFQKVKGIEDTTCGYANSLKEDVTYEEVCSKLYSAIETVKLTYNQEIITLDEIINLLFLIIDPTSVDKQGNDKGIQYRSGIYYTNNEKDLIEEVINTLGPNYNKEVVVEVKPLLNFYKAEEYHQDYLIKNVNGYCHVNMNVLPEKYIK